jgi:hypothetical protein
VLGANQRGQQGQSGGESFQQQEKHFLLKAELPAASIFTDLIMGLPPDDCGTHMVFFGAPQNLGKSIFFFLPFLR